MSKGVDVLASLNLIYGQGTAAPRYGLIGKLIGANMNATTDQPFIMNTGVNTYQPSLIHCTNASISLTTAVGGVYPAASKGGTAIVANTQVYSACNAATVVLSLTLAVTINRTTNPIYFALTTPQGSAATADLYIWGYIYS